MRIPRPLSAFLLAAALLSLPPFPCFGASLAVSSITPSSAAAGASVSVAVAGSSFDVTGVLTLERASPGSGLWTTTGSFTQARMLGTLTKLADGRVLLAGGMLEGAAPGLADCDIFDPATGGWTATGAMVQGRQQHAAVLLPDGRVLAVGGAGPAGTATRTAEIYDPAAGSWTAVSSMTNARSGLAMIVLADGRVLAAGGNDGAGPHPTAAEIYDPVGNAWSSAGSLATVHDLYPTMTMLRTGKVLLAGGDTAAGAATAELYDPAGNSWAATGSMADTHFEHQAVMLPDGRVLAAGGRSGPTATAAVYDPGTGTWTATSTMAAARFQHGMAAVAGVPIAFGGFGTSAALSTSEIYDATLNSWRAGPALNAIRYNALSVVLDDGKILVAGGRTGGAGAPNTNTAELLVMPWSVITATGLTVVSTTSLTATVSLTGAATGYWDVVVRQSGGRAGRLSGGFTVLPGPVVWDGGGATNDASEAANWSGDAVPADGDSVRFDATSAKNCTFDLAGVTFDDFTIDAGFSGDVTLSTHLVVGGDLIHMQGGSMNVTDQKVTIGGDYIVIENPGRSIGQDTEFIFNGNETQNISGIVHFNFLTIDSSSNVVISSPIITGDALTRFSLISGTFSAGGFSHDVGGDWIQTGGYFDAGGSTINFVNSFSNPGKNIRVLPGNPFNGFSIDTSTSVTALSALDIDGDFTLSGGTFAPGNFTHTVGGSWSQAGGVFAPSTGTIRFDGSAPQAVSQAAGSHFHRVEVASGAAVAAVSDLQFKPVFLPAGNPKTVLNIAAGAAFEAGASTLTFTQLTGVNPNPIGRFPFNAYGAMGSFLAQTSTVRLENQGAGVYWLEDSIAFNRLIIDAQDAALGHQMTGDAGQTITASFFQLAHGTLFTGGGRRVVVNGPAVFGDPGDPSKVGVLDVAGPSTVTISGAVATYGDGGPSLNGARLELGGAFTGSALIVGSTVTSTNPGTVFYTLTLDKAPQYSNLVNSVIESAAGVVVSTWPLSDGAGTYGLANVTFRDLQPGATALTYTLATGTQTWSGISFADATIGANVRAPNLASPGFIMMAGASGPRAGSAFENDPNGVVSWGAPAAPGSFAGAALSTAAIAWSWTDVTDETGYRVMSGEVNVSSDLAPGSTVWIQSGLTANAAYGPHLARAFNSSGTANSGTVSRYTLAAEPSGAAAVSIASTSFTVSWGLNGNPASTVAQLEKSSDAVSYAALASGAFASYAEADLLGCTTYYYRVRNANGDGALTAYASFQGVTANTIPQPPAGLAATANAGGTVSLAWSLSPTEGVTGYRLYWDAGSGTMSYGGPLAVLSSTATAYTTGVLASSASYTFALRTAHRCGVVETEGALAMSGAATAAPPLRAAIKEPDSGRRINGNRVTILGELVSGTPSDALQVVFQYKLAASTAWAIVPAANVNHPNPDFDFPYFTHWDVTAIAAGSYDLRAVAYDRDGVPDAAPSAVRVVVDPITPDISEGLTADGKIKKDQTVSSAVTSVVETAGSGASDPAVRVSIPAGVVNTASATVSVTANPVITTAAPSGQAFVGSAIKIDLSNGQTALNGTAAITLTYPDTVLFPSLLQIHYLDEATGQWSRDFASTVNTTSRTVSGNTPHFSTFALLLGTAFAADLNSVQVYPVPYKPNGRNADEGRPFSAGDASSGILFSNLAMGSEIKIYTLTGRLVSSLDNAPISGTVRWDAKNQDGRDVASGAYFAVITATGQKSVVKKLVIIR